MKKASFALLGEMCMKHEIKRAKRTEIAPKTFQMIKIQRGNGAEHTSCNQKFFHFEEFDTEVFAGQITIQDTLSAMRQAISEHTQSGSLRLEPGRHSYHVDAAVSFKNDLTGLAVVHKEHRKNWASPWVTRGFQLNRALDQTDAEVWAIWQALEMVLKKFFRERGYSGQDPCSTAVIYSDCQPALERIANGKGGDEKIVRRIVNRSIGLRQMGVEIQLHWVPGRRNVPGNELADLVAKRARQPLG